ncbi:MAG: glycoside hydrolase family 3 protein [Bifidobacteriaceae bacterium]|nr:glycoside hydrolase family 3 protein [Bifidobacteriaceae bacterium]
MKYNSNVKYARHRFIVFTLLAITVALVCVLYFGMFTQDADDAGGESTPLPTLTPTSPPEPTLEQRIDAYIAKMTLEQKIGQMFIIDLEALETGKRTEYEFPTAISDAQIQNLSKYKVGGIIYFSGNLTDRDSLVNYNKNLQSNSDIPLFISVDEEGGSVSRLAKHGNMGVTVFPNMQEIGATGDSHNALNVGETFANELSPLGFNLDFAPVADVNTNPENPVIGPRAFASDANLVAKMVVAEVNGLQSKISAVLKHFPGHGDTTQDSHTGKVKVNANLERLRKVELLPFKAGIDAGVDAVLTAHIDLPNVTDDGLPATMSREIVTDLLRNELNFQGIIITDALDMEAISDYYTPQQIVTNCINAGIDILLMPKYFYDTHDAFLAAVQSGEISEARIDESLRRIVSIKVKRGVIKL